MNNPKLSIIIPIFNSGRQVLDCLKSVFRSNYSDYEVIVVDNASKDGSNPKNALALGTPRSTNCVNFA